MKFIRSFIAIILISTVGFAEAYAAKFFSSNNTNIIDAHTAYDRLMGESQDHLKNGIIDILQKQHLQQNKCEDALGMYQMSDATNITADNTKIFITSPYETISDQTIFDIAKELANNLNQESIAVFIPHQETIAGNIIVKFTSEQPKLTTLLDLMKVKLPPMYSQAYSLHFTQKQAGYENAQVSSIEWLGSQLNLDEIKKVFPKESISVQNGKAFLVYKNGQKQEL